jgi:filamentous hemagglutinin family protein
MSKVLNHLAGQTVVVSAALLGWRFSEQQVDANPAGGSVAQGSATFNTSGSVETITTSGNAFINWSSFNIGAGETTTFVEPSSTSVVWNNINGSSPSQILGNLNANGYVILQNQAGFYVGGQASINAHGLVLTTASAAPNLSSGGAWEFDAPPPTAKIINYGQINIAGGGSAFLIADNIDNEGTIYAPSGNIGLYAGEKVLVSMSPDGRGLSAAVTLPQGSIDNNGQLIADGGAIAAQAQTVNQNGLVQANSVQDVNGTIELMASDAVNLGAHSAISAQGDSTGVSSGGSVTIQGGNTFSDQAGSCINISGGAQGGNGGQVEISAPQMGSIQSSINGQAAAGFVGGTLTIDPANIWLSAVANDPTTPSGYTSIDVNSYNGLSAISLQADNNIELNTVWTLPNITTPTTLSLTAGNDITFEAYAGIVAGNDWNVSLTAGTAFVPTTAQPTPTSGSDGVYLDDGAYIATQNGNINVTAANEVLIASDSNAGPDGIRTLDGGNIDVTATFGDVNTGANMDGYSYTAIAPYYTVSTGLGGISTAAGGNVNITAGGNVVSYLYSGSVATTLESDAGTGAFGPEPGNVTITAGGNVYGHYVLANGVGTITSTGGDIGDPTGANLFALSLMAGSWDINAPNGNIYLQEVRNPNGVFNGVAKTSGLHGTANPGEHLFNYSADAAVDLNAGIGVYLTDDDVPRPDGNVGVVYPPILDITAGAGGVTLEGNVTLFPSADQELTINTSDGGNLIGTASGTGVSQTLLYMSDSPQTGPDTTAQLNAGDLFSPSDNSATLPIEASSTDPVVINISGSMENLNLFTTKETQIMVGGDMINCGFSGQNLNASDITSIMVGGEIYNPSQYAFVNVIQPSGLPADELPPNFANSWKSIFYLALNPLVIATLQVPASNSGISPSGWLAYILSQASLFGSSVTSSGQLAASGLANAFVYNPVTGQLGFDSGYNLPFTSTLLSELTQPLTVLVFANGIPETQTIGGKTYFVTTTVNWGVPTATLDALAVASQSSVVNPGIGLTVGGPGQFDITASSIDLGDSLGILSCGTTAPVTIDSVFGDRYANLASITPTVDGAGDGASVNVTVTGDLTMLSSTIASLAGGDVSVTSASGSMDLGSPYLNNSVNGLSYGVYTTDGGNVNVTAAGDINIHGSRIATFNGGNIFIESLDGNVDAGSGGDNQNSVYASYVNPVNGESEEDPEAFVGSGILAYTLVPASAGFQLPPNVAAAPGNVTVETPRGDIDAGLAGIQQIALDGSVAAGPTVNLTAGSPGYIGNIDLGQAGAIGGTVNATATGNIIGVIVSRQNSNIQAAQNFVGTVVAGGTADVAGGGSVSGTIIGGTGADVSGGNGVSADVISQSANVNGVSSSTIGTSASATSSSQSAAQQASSQANQQVAADTSDNSDDTDDTKKKKPALLQHIKRVTVILPKST